MIPELILFDLDDTLMAFDLVTDKAWDMAADKFINENNLKIDKSFLLEKINETKKWYWGDPERHKIGRKNLVNARREVVKLALKHIIDIGDSALLCNTKLERFADNYTQIHETLWYLFEGAEETLQKIKEKNIKLGIVSNGTSEGQRGKLKRFDIEKYFDYFYIEGELGFGKPDARVFEYMLQETKIDSKKIIMIGDNPDWDIEPPQKLGIFSILFNSRGLNLSKNTIKPDGIIYKICDIIDYIRN